MKKTILNYITFYKSMIEVIFWVIISILLIAEPFLLTDWQTIASSIGQFVDKFTSNFLLGITVIVAITMFFLASGSPPISFFFSWLRDKKKLGDLRKKEISEDIRADFFHTEPDHIFAAIYRSSNFSALELISYQCAIHRRQAYRSFITSMLFIVGGISTAILGGMLLLVYKSRIIIKEEATWSVLLSSFTGLAVFVFVELVALFLLKQFRSAMDDFKYFDTVARLKFDHLIALKICVDNDGKISLDDFIKVNENFKENSILSAGSTTELVQLRNAQRGDMEDLIRSVESLIRTTKDKTK